jgi:predicted ATPase
VQRALRVAPHFDPAEEGDAIRELCRLVEGMPLAIVLAASWAGVMRCATITQEVNASLDFLRATMHGVPERHRSVRGLFDTSWGLLSGEAQAVFMRLSVFRGGFTAIEAQAVADATMGELRALVEKSLLRATGSGRFALHEFIRQYAAEKLVLAGEAEATARRHFDAYLALAEGGRAAALRLRATAVARAARARVGQSPRRTPTSRGSRHAGTSPKRNSKIAWRYGTSWNSAATSMLPARDAAWP